MKTTDAEIRHNLVGSWIAPAGSAWRFAQDGSWSHEEPDKHKSLSGTWQVTDAELAMTIMNYSGPARKRSPIGHVLYCTIVRVDDKELVEDLGEAVVTLQRQKT